MKPREINPDCIDDDAWWDIEALKLLLFHPETFDMYIKHHHDVRYRGRDGLGELGFLEVSDLFGRPGIDDSPANEARIVRYGRKLVDACKRVSRS